MHKWGICGGLGTVTLVCVGLTCSDDETTGITGGGAGGGAGGGVGSCDVDCSEKNASDCKRYECDPLLGECVLTDVEDGGGCFPEWLLNYQQCETACEGGECVITKSPPRKETCDYLFACGLQGQGGGQVCPGLEPALEDVFLYGCDSAGGGCIDKVRPSQQCGFYPSDYEGMCAAVYYTFGYEGGVGLAHVRLL